MHSFPHGPPRPRVRPARAPRGRRAGFTLIEVMVAILVLTVAVQILSSTVTASISYSRVKRERGLAVVAATNVIEEMHALPFFDVYATYNGNAADDPFGAGTAPGSRFDVPGLDPVDGAASVGRVEFPERNGMLCETVVDERLGTPRDLNGDMLIDGADRAEDHLVLPVVIVVEWKSKLGNRRFEIATMLMDLEKESEE